MKKKLLALVLVVVLGVTSVIGGTMAYLQDTDEAVNVMTLGNVDIEQLEKERIEQSDEKTTDANLKEFENDKPLYPAVYEGKYADWARDDEGNQVYQKFPTGGSSAMWTDSAKNAVDKIVFVENTGKSDAYVRTWFAFEQGSLSEAEFEAAVGQNINDTHWKWETVAYGVEIDGTKYAIKVATYVGGGETGHESGALPGGETTRPSLLQVMLYNSATNEDVIGLDGNQDGKYNILVVSQAIQTEGFENAEAALTAGFGEAVVANHPFDDIVIPTYVTTYEELAAALKEGGKIIIDADISVAKEDVMFASNGTTKAKLLVEDATVELDLNGHKITLDSENTNIRTMGTANLTIMDSAGTGEISTNSAETRMMSTQGNSVVTILGGTFTNTNTSATGYNGFSSYDSSVLKIYGGKFYIPSEKNSSGNWLLHNYNGKIIVYGGEFYGHNPAMGRAGTMYYGSKLVADGYYAYDMGENWYGIQKGLTSGQVAVNEYAFNNFEDAITNGKARRNGGVVDYHVAGEVTISAETDISAVNKGYASKVATVNVVGVSSDAKIIITGGDQLKVADGVTLNITDIEVVGG